jgi:hypothetical protein
MHIKKFKKSLQKVYKKVYKNFLRRYTFQAKETPQQLQNLKPNYETMAQQCKERKTRSAQASAQSVRVCAYPRKLCQEFTAESGLYDRSRERSGGERRGEERRRRTVMMLMTQAWRLR